MGLDMYLTKKTYIGHGGYCGPTCPHYAKNEAGRDLDRGEGGVVKMGDECHAFPEVDAEKYPHLAFIDWTKVKGISEEAGYWRKANAIHQWFVDNVQGGEDECKEHYVERSQLKELRDLCKSILDEAELTETGETYTMYVTTDGKMTPEERPVKTVSNVEAIKEKLPTASGFFFGSTEYDEWYLQDLTHTVSIIDRIFEADEKEMAATGLDYPSGDLYYQSSW